MGKIKSLKMKLGRLVNWRDSASLQEQRSFLDTAFPVFYPSSYNYWSFPDLTYSAANSLPRQLLALSSKIQPQQDEEPVAATAFGRGVDDGALGALLDKYGSDKFKHGYTKVYALIFEEIAVRPDVAILEIGLGTDDPEFISSMAGAGKPGASVRAFRDYLPSARVFGADLDEKILFQEDRLQTARVDQTVRDSFEVMWGNFHQPKLDLVIDDGLHSTEANLNTFFFAVNALKPGGYVVIEDIPERTLDVWRVLSRLLGSARGTLVKANLAYMYVWKKP